MFKRLFHSQGLRQSALLSGGNLLSTGISAISIILLSRFMGPAQFGAFSLAFALSMLTTKIFDFGYNMSLQKYLSQAKTPLDVNSLVSYSTRIKLIGSAAILAAALFLSPLLANFLKLDSSLIIFLGIGLGLIVYWFDFLAYILQGLSRFVEASLLAITQAFTKVLVIGALILSSALSAPAAYLGYGLAPLTGLALGFWFLKGKFKAQTQLPPKIKQNLWQMTKFTSILTIATVLTDYLDIFFVQRLTTQYDTGLYSAATRIALLVSVIAYSLNSVLNTRVAKYRDPKILKIYLKKAYVIAAGCLAAMFLVIPLSKLLLLFTAGSAYLAVDPTLKLLLASSFVMLATAPLAAAFYGLDFPLYFAIAGVLQVGLLVILNLILIPLYGLEGAGLARLLMRLGVLLITPLIISLALKKKSPVKLKSSPL